MSRAAVALPQRVRGAGIAAVLGVLALGALWLFAAPRALAAASGVIDGNVLNGTTGGTPLSGQVVALILHIGAGQQQIATTTTDSVGNFHFGGLATDKQDIYEASVSYEGATYTSDPISLAGDAHPPAITVLAYDATSSAAQIGVGRVTLLIQKPNVTSGTIRVVELLTVVNAGNQAFVGQTGSSGSMPTGLLRFAMPAGYTNLALQDGFAGGQVIQVNRGFASTVPVLPGETQFSFSFAYPYDGTQSTLMYEAVYPTVQVVLLAPPTTSLDVPGGISQGIVNAPGGALQVWQVGPLVAGKTAIVNMTRLPVPGETPNFDPFWLDVLAAVLAFVACGLVIVLLRRRSGVLVADAGAIATPVVVPHGVESGPGSRADGMLRALARLDRDHDAGQIEDAEYQSRRDELKAELKDHLLRSAPLAGGVPG